MSEDFDDSRPLYVRVADGLREAIVRGEYAVGAKLPSYSELSSRYGVSHMTVKQAIGLLKSEQVVTARQGMGVFVRTATAELSQPAQLAAMRSRLDDLEARVHAIEARNGQSGAP